jgi:hypothetical protein
MAANDSSIDVIGACDVLISNKNMSTNATVYISKGGGSNLLGRPQIEVLNLIAFVNKVTKSEFKPSFEFPKLFEGLGIMPGEFKISLRSDVEPLRLLAPRPIAAGLRAKAKAEIDRMIS